MLKRYAEVFAQHVRVQLVTTSPEFLMTCSIEASEMRLREWQARQRTMLASRE